MKKLKIIIFFLVGFYLIDISAASINSKKIDKEAVSIVTTKVPKEVIEAIKRKREEFLKYHLKEIKKKTKKKK